MRDGDKIVTCLYPSKFSPRFYLQFLSLISYFIPFILSHRFPY
jgi:hypothetical protein